TYTLALNATSSDGVTTDGVAMMVHVLVDGVDVEVETELSETWRDIIVSVGFNVTNTGQGNDTFALTVEGDEPDWAILSDESITVEEGETVVVMMEITPPSDADAGFYEFTLVATSANGITSASASTSVHVWVTGVQLTPEDDSLTGYRGDQLEFDITMRNVGQERDVFTLSHTGADWAESVIYGSNPVALDPDASGSVSITVILSSTIDQGIYTFTVTSTSSDGMMNESVELQVTVTVNGVEISLSQDTVTITKGNSKE
ncbi:MAG: hypothetical protein GWN18_12300, partial [Thermoplasmata archaeon]|nr:hypothetical protein [Thermoplasmata archaeon]NIS12835.1 hypothetical protein [Thermoplasmata archaeon]NIS20740.1 hypothetical protein [Thermoplasmata archaeon]NIT78144.1 hypothetical protein [Thermoplasmata archaeon]NIU49811.1 hypothetical protein [Thermoplasmata archaeon]